MSYESTRDNQPIKRGYHIRRLTINGFRVGISDYYTPEGWTNEIEKAEIFDSKHDANGVINCLDNNESCPIRETHPFLVHVKSITDIIE